jgi:2-amino-4-hydroxy-6-hydroxymethyldihydropteridine diphosphokinase
VYLGLGSNVGDRRAHLARALARIGELATVAAVSSVYETEPVGYAEQPVFWNLAVRVFTTLGPEALLKALKAIEHELGRTPTFQNGPRVIDIDILLWNDELRAGVPEIPHPRMMQRAFVLEPLVELDPELRHPVKGEKLTDALRAGRFERVTRLFGGDELRQPET